MLAGPFLLAGTAAVIARTGLVLEWRRSTVVLTTLLFAFTTMAAPYSQTGFSDLGVTLGAAIALLGIATWSVRGARAGAWRLGIGIACAALFRPDGLALVGIIGVGVFASTRPRELVRTWSQWAPGVVAPVALVMAWTLLYNGIRFGSAFNFGYGGPYDTRGFSTPLPTGVALQLISPGKSFFVYSPILLAAMPGLVWLWRRHRGVALSVIVASVVRVLFYARWWTPTGGASWGPRFLLPSCALLAIPLGAAVEHVRAMSGPHRRTASAAFLALAAISVVVQLLGTSTNWVATEIAAGNTHGLRSSLAAAVVAARTHRLHWTVTGSPIWQATNLARHNPTSLYWFRNSRVIFGFALLLAATMLVHLAWKVAARADECPHRAPA